MSRRRPDQRSSNPRFDPRMVPEIAAGYFWLPSRATGFGTSAFKVPEGGGHTAFDLAQATVANQPTLLTENGGQQFRLRKTGDNPASLTSTAAAAGWTGATYIGTWRRLPVDLTGTNNLFQHASTAPGSRMALLTTNGTPDIFRINLISGAQAFTNTTFSTPFADLAWHYIEGVFDPLLALGGTTSADYAKAFSGLVALTPVVAGNHPAAIADPISAVRVANTSGGTANNADVTDMGPTYYGQGIPSLFNRQRLMALEAPIAVSF